MFVIEVPNLNLNQIYDSNQVPLWIKLKEDLYMVIHKDKAIKVQQQRDRYDFNKYRLMFSCSEEDFYNIWFNYFDLETDYRELNYTIKKANKKLKAPCNKAAGIHIIKQDPWFVYIYTKLVEKFGYNMAIYAVNVIARDCGVKHQQSIREHGRVTWHEFPDAIMLSDNLHKLCDLGKANAWLKKLCNAVVLEGFDVSTAGNDLFNAMQNDANAFPSTIEVDNAIKKNFGCDTNRFVKEYLHEVTSKHVLYFYILHYINNPPKKLSKGD